MSDRLRLTFFPPGITDPVVCRMAKQFDVEFSIRRADIQPQAAWMDLSLEGDQTEIEAAIAWLEEQGVKVSPAGGDIMAG